MRRAFWQVLTLSLALLAAGCAGGAHAVPSVQSAPHDAGPAGGFKAPQRLNLAVPPPPPNFTPKRLAADVKRSTVRRPADASTAAFFAGATYLSNGVYWLQLPNGNPFGYYAYIPGAPDYIYHLDMGYEYVSDANDGKGGVYFYDFASSHWWYTGRQYPFPYIYDFGLSHFLYYYPQAGTADHYTANPRYFYDFSANNIITLPTAFGVSGTAATGKPLAGATVTLKDATGASRTGITASDGSYAIDTTTMTPPFFLQTQTAGGTKLYSFSSDTNALTKANLTPVTDVATRMWYGVQSIAVDTAFGSPTGTNAAPSPTGVTQLTTVVNPVVALWLVKAGVATSGFSPFTTPFAANGAGIDHVLSETTENQSTGHVTITDGSTTQNTAITYSGGSVTVATTTTGAGGTSNSTTTTVIPVTATQQSAQTAIAAQLNAFAAMIAAKGSGLQVSDVLPYLDPSMVNDGLNANQYAANFVANVAGVTVTFGTLQFKALDTAANTADVLVTTTISGGGQSQTQTNEFFFKRISGTWLVTGDGRPANMSLSAEARTNQGTFAPGGYNGPDINVDVQSPQGSLTSVTISGGGIWTSSALSKGATVLSGGLTFDHYFINSGLLQTTPAAGTPFTFAFQPGATPNIVLPLNTFTSELIQITSPTTSSISGANLGSPLTAYWTLPTTYAIASVQFSALSFTGNQSDPATVQCEVNANGLGTTATSATITIPPTCGGKAVLEVNLNVGVDGIDGERSQVVYGMQ